MAKKNKKPMHVMMTHLLLIARIFDKSSGPILEMGTGYFSTLFFDWLCCTFDRKVISYDNNKRWGQRALRYKSDYHEVHIVNDWDKADIDNTHWGLVFIDHAPQRRRHIDVIRLKDKADYIIMHDTEPEADKWYRYSRVWKYFKYRYDYDKTKPWTSVVSNFKDLKDIR